MTEGLLALATIVTTDLSGLTRGRSVPAEALPEAAATGVGWVPANLSLTAFGGIADPNPWGSRGDLRLLPDLAARFRTGLTGAATPFDMVMGDLVELHGAPWPGCTRTLLAETLADFRKATGLDVVAGVEQEFTLEGHAWPAAHAFSFEALRRAGTFAPRLHAALAEAGVEPEMVLAEYGADQFEVTCRPAPALAAADRAVAIRAIVREVAREAGLRACFSPKPIAGEVGNGVHVHLSLWEVDGSPATHDPAGPGGLTVRAARFCGGVLDHLPALVALTASSLVSGLRLRPHSWSSSYTWLGDRDREATLRICPGPSMGRRDPSQAFNIEYRAADATANPYLALAAIVQAGLDGIARDRAAPPVVSGDPEAMGEAERRALGLVRLPETPAAALDALAADPLLTNWLPPPLLDTLVGIRRAEMQAMGDADEAALCAAYRALY